MVASNAQSPDFHKKGEKVGTFAHCPCFQREATLKWLKITFAVSEVTCRRLVARMYFPETRPERERKELLDNTTEGAVGKCLLSLMWGHELGE